MLITRLIISRGLGFQIERVFGDFTLLRDVLGSHSSQYIQIQRLLPMLHNRRHYID